MHSVAASARRSFAAAARGNQRSLLTVKSDGRSAPLSLTHARHLSTAKASRTAPNTAKQDARAVEAAYARIVNKMVTLAKSKNFELNNVEEQIKSVVQFLEVRLCMSRTTAIRTVALHPMLTSYTEDVMERKMSWLMSNGVDNDMLQVLVRRHPMILGRSEETLETTKEWFLDHGIAESKIPFMFTVFPHAVSFAPENLNSKVAFLSEIGLDDNQIRRVLQRFPQVLTGSIESMRVKVDMAKDLGISDAEFVKMVTVVPEFLSLGMDQVKRKIRVLESLFGEGAATRVWLANPRIVMCNPVELRRSFSYLTNVVGLTPDRLGSQVSLIMRNVDRIIRPRYEFLRSLDSSDLEGVRWISMPASQFEQRFPEYPAFVKNEFQP